MRLLPILFFLLAVALYVKGATIDCGSTLDNNFSGGVVFTIANAPAGFDTTMRYSAPSTPFSYKLAADGVPYKVTLRFVESTVQAKGLRSFSVAANNQTVIDRMDAFAEAGFMHPFSRSFVAVGADGYINLAFTPQFRNAIISSIEWEPLKAKITAGMGIDVKRGTDGGFVVSLQTSPGGVRQLVWYEIIARVQPDGTYYVEPQPPYAGAVTAVGPIIFRNNVRLIGGKDFTIDPAAPTVLKPGPGWNTATDSILVEYWIVVNGGPTVSSPVSIEPVLVPPPGTNPGAGMRTPIIMGQKRPPWAGWILNPFPDIMLSAMRPGGPPLIPSIQPSIQK